MRRVLQLVAAIAIWSGFMVYIAITFTLVAIYEVIHGRIAPT
jgi:hypothetical protein